MDSVQQWLRQEADSIGIALTDRQLEQFELYYHLLVEWNEKMNLTGITEREAVYEKHFFDSLTVSLATDLTKADSLVDIGSGAGFPGIPLKIAFPHLRLAIVDSLNKRIRFLEEVASRLELANVQCIHGRAEDIARMSEHRDRYAVATARAVARLAGLNELCLPFVKPNGSFIAMKGADLSTELDESRYSASKLNAELREVRRLELPIERSERHLVILRKTGSTPKAYPRKAGTPLKTPLLNP